MTTYTAFNPRLRAYAHSRGQTADELSGNFPPWEFMEFIRRELRAFCDSTGRKEARLLSPADHEEFTGYLLAKYQPPAAGAA